jgi:hypothetical protein
VSFVWSEDIMLNSVVEYLDMDTKMIGPFTKKTNLCFPATTYLSLNEDSLERVLPQVVVHILYIRYHCSE